MSIPTSGMSIGSTSELFSSGAVTSGGLSLGTTAAAPAASGFLSGVTGAGVAQIGTVIGLIKLFIGMKMEKLLKEWNTFLNKEVKKHTINLFEYSIIIGDINLFNIILKEIDLSNENLFNTADFLKKVHAGEVKSGEDELTYRMNELLKKRDEEASVYKNVQCPFKEITKVFSPVNLFEEIDITNDTNTTANNFFILSSIVIYNQHPRLSRTSVMGYVLWGRRTTSTRTISSTRI